MDDSPDLIWLNDWTPQPSDDVQQRQPFMFGQQVDTSTGLGPTAYAFPMPCADDIAGGRAVAAMEDPLNHCISVAYIQFYPYNLGKEPIAGQGRWDDHIGDFEGVLVIFMSGKPTMVAFAAHSLDEVYKQFYSGDVSRDGNHPIAFAAKGSHGTWVNTGSHDYETWIRVYDECSWGVQWNLDLNLQLVMPDRKFALGSYDYTSWWVMPDSKWPRGTRPFYDIYRWGDPRGGTSTAGQYRREPGPTGFMEKGFVKGPINNLKATTNCGGFPMEVCSFPHSIYDMATRPCPRGQTWRGPVIGCTVAPGLSSPQAELTPDGPCMIGYEHANNACWLRPFLRSYTTGGCGTAKPQHVSCGGGWVPWGQKAWGKCLSLCVVRSTVAGSPQPPAPGTGPAHYVCNKFGWWVQLDGVGLFDVDAKVQYTTGDFTFNSGADDGQTSPYLCRPMVHPIPTPLPSAPQPNYEPSINTASGYVIRHDDL